MVLKINKEILNFIRNSDYDENIKKFLIESLLLEFKRDKADYAHYSAKYDKIIERYVL